MKTNLYALALVAAIFVPAVMAQEGAGAAKKGKGKGKAAQSATSQLLKQLEPAGLTAEQTAKIEELGKKVVEEIKKIESEAGLTPELLKKRREVTASMKDSDKKGKEKAKAIDEASGLNEAQSAAVAKANALRMKLKKDAVKLLSDEQKAKLPKEFIDSLGDSKEGGAKKGGKKGKKKDN